MTPPSRLSQWRDDATAAWRRSAREARRWGLPGVIGAVLLVLAAVLALEATPRAREALRDEEQAMQLARRRAAEALQARLAVPAAVDPAERFRAAFPTADQRHRRIDRLIANATAAGVPPRRSDVRQDASNAGLSQLGLTRVRVVVPLTGSYAALRRHVEQSLQEDATLALDSLRFERSDPTAPVLRAELQWSLWMQSTEATPDPRLASTPGFAGSPP